MRATLALVALAFAACGGSPQPGDPGYSFNLNGEYSGDVAADDGSSFAATITFQTMPGGEITGTMSITDPMVISGEVSGLLVGAEAALTMPYMIEAQGCGGTAEGSLVVDEGGATASGAMDITEDNCGGGPTAITMTLTRN